MTDKVTPENSGMQNFVERAHTAIESAASNERFQDTRHNRVQRRFSIREVCEFLGFSRPVVNSWLDQEDAPEAIFRGRENTLSTYDILKLRALAASRAKVPGAKGRKPTMFWRKPGDPLPVITFASQKGGTGKSLAAAHVAQAATLFHGLRVGIIDSDPQASVSLYFADETIDVAGADTDTFTRFMGVPAPNEKPLRHTAEELDEFWLPTPWPGIRLIPGGAPIQEADISMFLMSRDDSSSPEERRIYRLLKDTLDRWSEAHPPKTMPEDLRDEDGKFLEGKFQEALYETFDLIIIDCAPSMTLSQLNSILASTTLVVPNTLRGFDLSTLKVFLGSVSDYLVFVRNEPNPIDFGTLPSYILPSNVQSNNDTDVSQVGELYYHDPEVICPVYFAHSAAVANAARDYQSIYEYEPDKNRRKSAEMFQMNANAVADAILSKAIPRLPPRGYANDFIKDRFGGLVPPWTTEADDSDEPEPAQDISAHSDRREGVA